MVTKRACQAPKSDGSPCTMPPLRESRFCLSHDPEHVEDAQEARRLGGQRRRKEHIVPAVYDFEGLDTVPRIRRLVGVAALDTLRPENSVNRNRALIAARQSAPKLLEMVQLH